MAPQERSEALLGAGYLTWPELLAQLAEPFPVEAISWRAGSVSRDKKRAQALPYAEPRVYEDRLNALCPGLWSVAFRPWGERIICELTIGAVGPDGAILYATRASTGEPGDSPAAVAGTAAEAQAFKRACSKFGLGRYLYDVPITWVDYDDASRKLLQTPSLPQSRPLGRRLEPLTERSLRATSYSRPLGRRLEPLTEARFVPEAQPAAKTPRASREGTQAPPQSTPASAPGARLLPPPETAPPAAALTPARAEAMHRELEKLGLSRSAQQRLAKSVLGRDVAAFDQLLESEALEVWNAAKRAQTPRRAVGF
ncbi:hypothetical protein [Truepera radiovictrix]|uniref:Rad52/22 double-strand break repair protein n=1 Tax=Truepera radiovictrix (strain DSM 17093 / CIP 108686 / LMG 22925 / RQ-24) TaxID=649638 RepID=D7CRI2_TRURR|nr:hypothetical protein [Truepera radiovictrix]ADI13472.1 conserved hypothetical protein [Truepera radiovictrix DSM 17093]WMT57967.1 hypothetical protein RCV51_03210 [Truepera radiovictrix]